MRLLTAVLGALLAAQSGLAAEPAAKLWARGMSLRDKVAQLVVIPFYGEAGGLGPKQRRDLVRLVRQTRVGGLVLVNRVDKGIVVRADPETAARLLNRLQALARVPLIVAGDFERGASMRFEATTRYPHAMAFGAAGDTGLTRELGMRTAAESRALGFHWIFSPVADVNSNPDNPIVNIRSFGEEPEVVAAHVRAFIEGAHSSALAPVLVTAKHFPGHGDTSTDSHLTLPAVQADRGRLDAVELVPFRAAIEAGVDSVMTAHVMVPALEKRPVPATASSSVLTGLLRKQMRFGGLLVTDAMDMQGLTNQFSPAEAAVRALEAGADVLLMPANPEKAIQGVVDAVRKGRLAAARIDESLSRLLEAKARLGLRRNRTVKTAGLAARLNPPAAAQLARKAADGAVRVVRDPAGLLPLREPAATLYLLLTEDRRTIQGQQFQKEMRRRVPAASVIVLDTGGGEEEIDAAVRAAAAAKSVVVAVWVTVASYRGNVSLGGRFPHLVKQVLAGGAEVILVALGNPYVGSGFPDVGAVVLTYSTVPASETAAVATLLAGRPSP